MRIIQTSILIFALGLMVESSPQQKKLDPKTHENVMSALKGEAFAYAKYMLYAEQARQNGHADVADLFEKTARMELSEHFRELAQIEGLVRSDTENLQDAIHGETYESQTMYPQFADQAAASGDMAAAERFRELSRDEMSHRKAFHAALSSLEKK